MGHAQVCVLCAYGLLVKEGVPGKQSRAIASALQSIRQHSSKPTGVSYAVDPSMGHGMFFVQHIRIC